MFKYYIVEDLITLEVSEYLHDKQRILRHKMEDKYVDKIINGIGLVVLIDDIVNTSKPKILPNDACALFYVNLKLLVFSPEREESMIGTVSTSDSTGIGITLDFFNDVKIIPHFMPRDVVFDKESKAWYRDDLATKQYYKVNSKIEFSVIDVTFNEMNDASKDEQLPVMLVLGALK